MVEDRHLNLLYQQRPAQPHYLERGKPGKFDVPRLSVVIVQ